MERRVVYARESEWEMDYFANELLRGFEFEYLSTEEMMSARRQDRPICVWSTNALTIDQAETLAARWRPLCIFVLSNEHGRDIDRWLALGEPDRVFHQYPLCPRIPRPAPARGGGRIPLGYARGFRSRQDVGVLDPGQRTRPWAFVGAPKSDRAEMLQAFESAFGPAGGKVVVAPNPWSIDGLAASPPSMFRLYAEAYFVPIGRGNASLDCFRLYEAILAGAIPVLVGPPAELESTLGGSAFAGGAGTVPHAVTAATWDAAAKACEDIYSGRRAEFDGWRRANLDWWDRCVGGVRRAVHALVASASAPVAPSVGHLVRLIDCILYNGEPVAALRLAAVYPHVDEIVVVEARQTFTGLRKPALCIESHISVFAPFVDKLTFVVVEFPPEVLAQGAWACETYQRNAPAERIRARWAGSRYVVMVCDVDEIPSAPVLAGLRDIHAQLDAPVYLVMHLLFYNFDWCKVEPWARAFVVNERCALTFEECRTGYRRDRFLQNAGHHLSYFMGVDEMRRKLDSFSHTEVNIPQVNNAEWLRGCIERGIDIIGRERSKDRKRLVPTPSAVRASFPPGWEALQAHLLVAASSLSFEPPSVPSPSSSTPATTGVWLGYLTWRRRQVFARTLASHDRSGLLACIPPAHRVVFCQEATEADRVLAAEYQCAVLDQGSPTNVGILAAFVRILASVPPECPYLLFCEDDWAVCDGDGDGGHDVVSGVLADAVGLLADGHADVVRLRSRRAPGEPLYSQREWERIAAFPEQRRAFPYKLESICWLADGQALAAAYQTESPGPEVLRHVAGAHTGRPWYVTTTEHQRWSNNVFLASVDALRARVLPVLRDRTKVDGVGGKLYGGLEDVLVAELGAGELRIAAGDGIFTHSDQPDLPPRGPAGSNPCHGDDITYHDFWSSFYTGEETAVDRWRAYLEAMVRPIMRARGRPRAEIWSVFGSGPGPSALADTDVLRVQYSGESFFQPPERFDVNFVPSAASPWTIPSTQAATYLSVHRLWAQVSRARAFPREMDWATRRFAVMVASNPRAAERTRFFDFLSRAYRTVDACGSVRRNWAGPVPTRFDTPAYRSFLGQWRFVLCFENARGPWYVTEKVVNAYVAGCIPVYWGCPPADLERLGFNLRAMVYVDDHDAARAAVAALDADPARARAVFEQPLLAHPDRLRVSLSGTPSLARYVAAQTGAATATVATTVAFWDDQLTERGTTTALFDYAWHNRETLGHRSVVLFDCSSSVHHHPAVVAKFRSAFGGPGEFVEVDGFAGVDAALARLTGKVVLYTIRSGQRDGRVSRLPGVRTVVHCVFSALAADRHGDVYAAISRSVDTDLGADELPVVPHMVALAAGGPHARGPEFANKGDGRMGWRKAADIPADAVVFGRHGGYTTFDIPWVHAAVVEVAQRCPHIFFVFVNTRPFSSNVPNIKYLPAVVDLGEKAEFIRGCDAMLWGRSDGETFGLAVAEFSALNRPVFARRTGPGECSYVRDPNAHVEILGDRGQLYTQATLAGMLEAFVPSEKMPDGRSWSAYDDYTPAKVMQKFAEVFLY